VDGLYQNLEEVQGLRSIAAHLDELLRGIIADGGGHGDED
jgi:hypothetical protein